ncbi:MAG: hypothetical protein IPH52_15420 [Leptospiraceae bacterium]|nr:hypothetical protein [Leptospiraceae bacterium]
MKRTLPFLLIILLLSCNKSGDSFLELSLLYKRLLNLNRPILTLNGKAQMTGSIKNATVQARTIPTSGTDAGKCNGTAGSLLANGITTSGFGQKQWRDLFSEYGKTGSKFGLHCCDSYFCFYYLFAISKKSIFMDSA